MILPTWLVPWKLYLLGIVSAVTIATITLQQQHITRLQNSLQLQLEGRRADRATYAKAQAEATVKNLEDVRKAEAKQEQISKERSIEYQAGLADLRTRYQRLLSNSPTKDTPGSSSLPKAPSAPSGPDGTDELLLPSERLLRAQEIELQLMELQRWNREQAEVTIK